ncbi:RdgB/HAM1 family non-canonical purine NTP pyrophosphatase [Daejeonella sp.]|uniref:RdgB/HAM1 family non-canonical purine NTP pyrophosphatase n=1 Tax=Daejeonella sp. TaxID=2805397 RepID=UPI0030C40C4D
MELVFASNNQHKVDEIQAIAGNKFILKSLNDISCFEEIPETGHTFEANAGQKSRFIYDRYNINCFGDDSGLEIDALDGEPGVDSAHYSGSRDFQENMQLVLSKLGDNPDRRARFRTVISLILNGTEHLFEGVIEGRITKTISGTKGFGYDPIFIPDNYNITFAEMDAAEKNRISHRGIAVKKMVGFLNK